ncbi:glycosyl transferase family 4-domain-containing protein [Phascolomyces articulosus]|uniref:UDP-N-acetylglucosamine--dolichyl-phosphate N-acetylglucosaminephosphotransferase n=1 Tax=Phascolomyces articulosus TaxID=60185 RepID=A0AAD5PK98_9FUNG|nr:glycosyl transferase family 4-domain-containing protein [Phascolomyces articulosus]
MGKSIWVASLIVVAFGLAINVPLPDTVYVSISFAILAGVVTWKTLPRLAMTFVNARVSGVDVLKPDRPVIPEAMGFPTAVVYLIAMFCFIPFPFIDWFDGQARLVHEDNPMIGTFPYHKLGQILSAILAIQSMVLLGFADDILDVRWRYKVWFPAVASIPLLIFYYTNFGVTYVVLPLQLRPYVGDLVDLGPFYYLYMVMLVIFCTHTINILAGINGIEAGQSLIIALSVIINDLLFMFNNPDRESLEAHLFSLYFMLPFAGVTFALLTQNWFPARVFVGDTYCYFAGITFAVVGILGHFSKTLVLFFIPQIFNFLYSCPQLFRFVDCPRHRMPRLDSETKKLRCSTVIIKPNNSIRGKLGYLFLKFLYLLGLLKVFKRGENGRILECNNLTIINLVLARFGPMSEVHTTRMIMGIQVLSSLFAFFIRYKLVQYVY